MKLRTLLFAPFAFTSLLHADTPAEFAEKQNNPPAAITEESEVPAEANTAVVDKSETLDSFVRVNATIQTFNPGQPWQRNNPTRRSGLGTLISKDEILTTAAMVANETYLELETADSSRTIPAKVVAIDYKANLALLSPRDPDNLGFLAEKTPLKISGPANIGDEVSIWQFESNGITLKTTASIRGVDTVASFLPGYSFLSYIVKGSMQSASSSFTLPVTRDGQLLGVLTSYNSNDQISQVITPEVLATFLRDARDGTYEGFPSLGIGTQRTEDRSFRQYLGLNDENGGLYISDIKPGSPAEEAKIQEGDVLLAVNNMEIDRKGYFEHPSYGPLPWTVLIRSEKTVGDEVELTIFRDGQRQKLSLTLEAAEEPLVPRHINDSPPPFLIKGGLVFQELSRTYLQAFGDNWTTRAPLDLMEVYENEKDYREGRNSIVFLSRVIPNPATIGYDQINARIVESANGQPIADLAGLAAALATTPESGIHQIDLQGQPNVLYLDAAAADEVDAQLLQSGLPALSRIPAAQE